MEYAAEADKVDESVFVSRATITEAVRNEIFHRDGYVCVDCGSGIDLQIDHIIPFSRGGLTEKSNLQTMCRKCNSKKGNRI
ncbi:MAG: HNH endonuclease [Desulfobacteraceae bacterium]|jgi:5-methylcytosine-specific restriction endonuclease McrA